MMTQITTQPKVKIFWSEEEIEALAQQVALLRLDPNYLTGGLTQLVPPAQQVLPEERRRPSITSYAQVSKDFEKRVATHMRTLINRPPEVKVVEKEVPKIEYVKTEPAEAVREATAGTILDELLRRIPDHVSTLVLEPPRREAAPAYTRSKAPTQEPEARPLKSVGPTVLTLGFSQNSFLALQNRLKDYGVRLKWVDTGNGKVERVPSGANYVVVSPGHQMKSHKWTKSAVALYGRERVFTVPGRTKQAEDAILALVARGEIPSAPVNGNGVHP
jgi:hypothetical protein